MGNEAVRGSDLNNWMMLLTRFTNKPLPKSLINQIDKHFSYYWSNDRLNQITRDDEYLNQCPRQVKKHIMLHYLFDDIIYKHRDFFINSEHSDSKFLYDVCFGMKPIKFYYNEEDNNDQNNLILDEETEVTDMYFIQGGGTIGIGFYLMTQGLSKKQFEIGIKCENFNYYICDYYVCFN